MDPNKHFGLRMHLQHRTLRGIHPYPSSGNWPRTFLLAQSLYYIYLLAAEAITSPQSSPVSNSISLHLHWTVNHPLLNYPQFNPHVIESWLLAGSARDWRQIQTKIPFCEAEENRKDMVRTGTSGWGVYFLFLFFILIGFIFYFLRERRVINVTTGGNFFYLGDAGGVYVDYRRR